MKAVRVLAHRSEGASYRDYVTEISEEDETHARALPTVVGRARPKSKSVDLGSERGEGAFCRLLIPPPQLFAPPICDP
jgi:hypothetical protein